MDNHVPIVLMHNRHPAKTCEDENSPNKDSEKIIEELLFTVEKNHPDIQPFLSCKAMANWTEKACYHILYCLDIPGTFANKIYIYVLCRLQ